MRGEEGWRGGKAAAWSCLVARDAILIAPHGMFWAEGSVLQHSAFLKHAPDFTRASILYFIFFLLGSLR